MGKLPEPFNHMRVTGLAMNICDGDVDYDLYPHAMTIYDAQIRENGTIWAVAKALRFRRYARRMIRQK